LKKHLIFLRLRGKLTCWHGPHHKLPKAQLSCHIVGVRERGHNLINHRPNPCEPLDWVGPGSKHAHHSKMWAVVGALHQVARKLPLAAVSLVSVPLTRAPHAYPELFAWTCSSLLVRIVWDLWMNGSVKNWISIFLYLPSIICSV
jgi:hypothetical protein